MCILYVHASASMHLILGTLGTARGRGAHDVETDDGVWWTYPEGGRTGQVLGPEMSPRRCKLTELTCVGSQASPGAF